MRNKTLNLRDIQSSFVKDLLSETIQNPYANSNFSTSENLIESRLESYRQNLFSIWNQSLKNIYPVLFQLVGEHYFQFLSIEYGKNYPSQSGNLNEFGQYFSDFIQSQEELNGYVYFSDIALLEWNVHQAYYAKDVEALTSQKFFSEAAQYLQQATLSLKPSIQFLISKWAVAQIWQAHQSENISELTCELDAGSIALVIRRNWVVEVHNIELSSYLALQELVNGHTLEHALNKALEVDANFDVVSNLNFWFSLEIFCDFQVRNE